jgi:tetratricopeptide (TPR) repeat protein
MKKIVLILILCLSAARLSFAQNNMEAMRFLTINALMDYGQKLYERGDYDEASAVFNHVLTYDGHQAQALGYIKEMGRSAVPTLNKVDVSDTGDLKKAIEAHKQVIKKLETQIMQMRTNLAVRSAEK